MFEAARRVDQLGYDHLWTWDHLYSISATPNRRCSTAGGSPALARETERARLGLLVGANTFRNPGLVAKMATTLDHVSGGRAILGIGGGMDRRRAPRPRHRLRRSVGERLDWLDEAVGRAPALDGDAVSSEPDGRYPFDDLRQEPLPVQAHLPIMIGGAGERKTLRIVARTRTCGTRRARSRRWRHKVEVLQGHCDAMGRDIAEIGSGSETKLDHPRHRSRGRPRLEGGDRPQPDAAGGTSPTTGSFSQGTQSRPPSRYDPTLSSASGRSSPSSPRRRRRDVERFVGGVVPLVGRC